MGQVRFFLNYLTIFSLCCAATVIIIVCFCITMAKTISRIGKTARTLKAKFKKDGEQADSAARIAVIRHRG